MPDATPSPLDRTALKVNQSGIVVLVVAGFVLNMPILPAFVALILLAGSLSPVAALFVQLYARVLKPLGLLQPDLSNESPAPHRFAQILGGAVLAIASALLFLGNEWVGWALAWLVVLLALLNLIVGFCAGCFLYYQLGRLGVLGLRPPESSAEELDG